MYPIARLSRTKHCAALVVCLLGFAATNAQSAIIFFTNEAAWSLAAGSPSFTEDFQGFAADTPFRTAPVALNGMSIQLEGTQLFNRNLVDVPPLQFTDNNGTSNASILLNHPEGSDPGTQVRISFATSNQAFGFHTWDAANGEGAVLEAFNGTTLLGSQALSDGPNQFLGYVLTEGDTATSVRFRASMLGGPGLGEGFGLDNIAGVAASAVPAPATLALLAIALAGLGFTPRKRLVN